MEADWLDRFINLLPSCPTLLDVGCGSGEPMDDYLVAKGCDLTGVDSAPEMIAQCQARLPGQTWHVSDMRSLCLGQVFDGILAWDSFFHLCPNDQRQMFPIFRAHAASRATLMFTSGPEHGVAMGTFEGEPLYHASLNGTEYRALLAGNGFDVVAQAVEDPTCGRHTIWLAQLR
jgi:trans-aconitate methyltransferase